MRPDDICPRPEIIVPESTAPAAQPIYLASVYACEDIEQASELLSGEAAGYVYRRDGHPNADALARLCGRLHGAEHTAITASGMAALGTAALALLRAGDQVLLSSQLYGRTRQLFTDELARFGVESKVFDPTEPAELDAALTTQTKLVVVETIANPLLRVADVRRIAASTHGQGALLLVDNTLAGPVICRPLEWGADLVVESLTKFANGHSDVLLGMICGGGQIWDRIVQALTTWGATASPLECWLAARGMGTLALRVERASANAAAVAEQLATSDHIEEVHYPGRAIHPDHELAARQFGTRFGWMVTFTLKGGGDAVRSFIAAARQIDFSPSLGELATTLSHPASTSHRGLSAAQREALGIGEGTLRLSVGIESPDFVKNAVGEGLAAVR